GIEVQDTPFVSDRYTRWLLNEGFTVAKYINIAETVLKNTKKSLFESGERREARRALQKAHDEAVAAFDATAIEQSGDHRDALVRARNALKKEIENAAEILEYDQTIRFKLNEPWYEDPMINEFQFNWN
ncbi:MAG: hypothetical protein PUD63_04955, partial [Clostridia bacterium]|nr:hypothetical protein [Clostridia bacterium]